MEDIVGRFPCLERRLQAFLNRRARSPSSAEEVQASRTRQDLDLHDNSLLMQPDIIEVQPATEVSTVVGINLGAGVNPAAQAQSGSNPDKSAQFDDPMYISARMIGEIINKAVDRGRDEVVNSMKDQFIIFSNQLDGTDQEVYHISSRVSLLEASCSEIKVRTHSKTKTELEAAKKKIPTHRPLSCPDTSNLESTNVKTSIASPTCYKVLRNGKLVGKPKIKSVEHL